METRLKNAENHVWSFRLSMYRVLKGCEICHSLVHALAALIAQLQPASQRTGVSVLVVWFETAVQCTGICNEESNQDQPIPSSVHVLDGI